MLAAVAAGRRGFVWGHPVCLRAARLVPGALLQAAAVQCRPRMDRAPLISDQVQPLPAITARHCSHTSSTSSRERQTCERDSGPFTSRTSLPAESVSLQGADCVQVAFTFQFVQLETRAKRDGMAVPDSALQGAHAAAR